jgi:hypothetical protein
MVRDYVRQYDSYTRLVSRVVNYKPQLTFHLPYARGKADPAVVDESWPKGQFDSTMTIHQHRALNTLLNQQVEFNARSSHPIKYTRERHVDTSYMDRTRVTRDAEGNVLAVVRKERLGTIDVFNPMEQMDWRMGVSVEGPRKSAIPSYSLPCMRQCVNRPLTVRRDADRPYQVDAQKRPNMLYARSVSSRLDSCNDHGECCVRLASFSLFVVLSPL